MSTPLEREPTSFTAGDTLAWIRSLADYPASDGWELAYRFINAAAKFDITAAADGDDHVILEAAADTAGYTAGTYAWQAFVTKATERYTVGTGFCEVKPNLAAVSDTGYDDRTPARKALDALNSGLEQFGSNAHVQGYSIEGREMRYRNFAEFMAARDRLVQEVAREDARQRAAAGLASKNRLRVQFRRP
jgi:hypothetical protein